MDNDNEQNLAMGDSIQLLWLSMMVLMTMVNMLTTMMKTVKMTMKMTTPRRDHHQNLETGDTAKSLTTHTVAVDDKIHGPGSPKWVDNPGEDDQLSIIMQQGGYS